MAGKCIARKYKLCRHLAFFYSINTELCRQMTDIEKESYPEVVPTDRTALKSATMGTLYWNTRSYTPGISKTVCIRMKRGNKYRLLHTTEIKSLLHVSGRFIMVQITPRRGGLLLHPPSRKEITIIYNISWKNEINIHSSLE